MENTLPAECGIGFNICGSDSTQCCEVICENRYHICGELLNECCLDTTSNDFTWNIDTLGTWGSYLNDVAIINENDIWVVGVIMIDNEYFNTAHWDGNEWEIPRFIRPAPFAGVYSFHEDDLWFVDGCNIYHFDGDQFELMWECDWTDGLYNKIENIWGISSTDIFFYGRGGWIVHFNGNTFTIMDTGITADVKEIWGVYDEVLGEYIIWACGFTQQDETVILKLQNGIWQKWFERDYDDYIYFDENVISGPIISIWSNQPEELWAITYFGLFKINADDSSYFERYPNHDGWGNGYILNMTGNNWNDIYFTGDKGGVWHFNGEDSYQINSNSNLIYYRVESYNNTIISVGEIYSTYQGIINVISKN